MTTHRNQSLPQAVTLATNEASALLIGAKVHCVTNFMEYKAS
jgi:hypothetical protein